MLNIPDLSTISLISLSLICHIRISSNSKYNKTTTCTLLEVYSSQILNRWIDNDDNNISPRKNVDIAFIVEEKKLQRNPFSACDTITMGIPTKIVINVILDRVDYLLHLSLSLKLI